jgi:hypothetical protein
LGQLLIDGIRLANIVPTYYSQVAASMVQADRERFDGRFQVALTSSFIERGILEPAAVVALAHAEVPRSVKQPVPLGVAAVPMAPMLLTLNGESDGYLRTAHDAPELPMLSLQTRYLTLVVSAANERQRYDVAPASLGAAPTSTRTAEDDARAFVEDLVQLGRIDFEPARAVVAPELMPPQTRRPSKKTHTLVVTEDNKIRLKRLHFDCWCARCAVREKRKKKAR